MAQQTINLGASPNDGTGDTLRDGGDKINDNFTELYSAIANFTELKGDQDCSANPNYPAALKGDLYYVTVAGKIGGASGKSVDVGDVFIAKADNAGGTEASVGTSWFVLEHNLTGVALLSGATFTGAVAVPDDAYDATTWNGSANVPTKNAVRDKIEAILAGVTFTGDIVVPAEAYAVGWNGSNEAPTKNDVYDKIEAVAASIPGGFTAASTSDVLTATDTAKGVTADALAALWEKGGDIASAGTITVDEGGFFHVTGTTGITDIDFTVDHTGRAVILCFTGALILTNGANLILPTGANITTAAGDCGIFVSEGSDAVRCVMFLRASGAALVASTSFAVASDINTGTDTTKALNSDALAGSNFGIATISLQITDPAGAALTTGDGKAYFRVPSTLNGMNLIGVAAAVTTVSSSGLPTIQIANVTDAVDMLSTKLTIDASETDSATAATPAVIDGAHDDVATADMLRIDCDVAGTGAKGLIVELQFQLP